MNQKQFVSRGGLKMQHAIEQFGLNVTGFVVLDVGSSTGGFVDCLLQNGAAKVYAVDTAYGEFAWTLRNDPRVVVMERTNILYLDSLPTSNRHSPEKGNPLNEKTKGLQNKKKGIGIDSRFRGNDGWQTEGDNREKGEDQLVDLITIDASWTKLEKILPVVQKFLKPSGQIIALLKPHYQSDKKDLVKGVLPIEKAEIIKEKVILQIQDLGFKIQESIDSPILGGGGNHEYLLLISSS